MILIANEYTNEKKISFSSYQNFLWLNILVYVLFKFNPIAPRMSKTLLSFGLSECYRVKKYRVKFLDA